MSFLSPFDSLRGSLLSKFSAARQRLTLQGLSSPAQEMLIAALSEKYPYPVLVVASHWEEAEEIHQHLETFAPRESHLFPVSELLPYERISSPPAMVSERQKVLDLLGSSGPSLVVTTQGGLHHRISPTQKPLVFQPGKIMEMEQLSRDLVSMGYQREVNTEEPGQFSMRGCVLDLYPLTSEAPFRIEFFGNEIESIRTFDPVTQRSLDSTDEVELTPAREFSYPDDAGLREALARMEKALQNSRKNISLEAYELLEATVRTDMERIKGREYFEGFEYYLPFWQEPLYLLDLLPPETLVIFCGEDPLAPASKGLEWIEQAEELYRKKIELGQLLTLPKKHHLDAGQLKEKLEARKTLYLLPFHQENPAELSVEIAPPPLFRSDTQELVQFIRRKQKEGFRIHVDTSHPQRVVNLLSEHFLPADYGEQESGEKVGVTSHHLFRGFVYPGSKYILLTDLELFNWQSRQVAMPTKAKASRAVTSVTQLKAGDYVVHSLHGVALFQGIESITLEGMKKEYLRLEYAAGDKIYVPVEQIGLVSHYASSPEHPPKLNRLGGTEWVKAKKKAQKSIKALAEEMLQIYAKRAELQGYAFPPDTPWQQEIESSFPYQETPDQLKAIEATKQDMESTIPMDRLICGDVGFGKTEVAMRAVFKAVVSGKQAAILVPTTILAQQHFQVFSERFAPYPITIRLLSRFHSPKENSQTVKGLAEGKVDLVIGTHRLLQKDIKFKDLGLVVVDEEHRFGVAHKEKLKQLRALVDVISMSATPIPRTLYMALNGVRDLSVIATPPPSRSPVKTIVAPAEDSVISRAILQELDRGGQIFFLHNRVESIEKVAGYLKALVPRARIGIAHGQLSGDHLETVMLEFLHRKYDILLATTIIESGLDIPNANTIIINHADKLGLSQLHQLRGRVGRSETKAYAYCLYSPEVPLSPQGKERLKALSEFSQLGSGYQIALRDMELRGVGNLLGTEQHGNMAAMGFDLYCRMLEEAVSELKGNPVRSNIEEVTIDLPVGAYLPEEWAGDIKEKLFCYRQLAQASGPGELEELKNNWIDRFGPLPQEVAFLFALTRIKLMAAEFGVNEIKSDSEYVRIQMKIPEPFWFQCRLSLNPKYLHRFKWFKDELQIRYTALPEEERIEAVSNFFESLRSRVRSMVS